MKARVLVVGDREDRSAFDGALVPPDFVLRFETDPDRAAAKAAAWQPEVILLDIALRSGSGLALRLLRVAAVPGQSAIVLYGPAESEDDLVRGLGEGALSFFAFPCPAAELQARVRAFARHLRAASGREETLKLGPVLIDRAGRRVQVAGRRVLLTPKEFEILDYLADSAGRVLSRRQILERVWGLESSSGPRNVDYQVFQLRKKLGSRVSAAIETVAKLGYCFRPDSLG